MPAYVEGGRVTFGGREFIVPKATLRTCLLMDDVQKAIGTGEITPLVGMAGMLLLVLKPAQPELTIQELLDLPMNGPEELLSAFQEANLAAGFKRAPPGEAPSP